MTARWSGGKDAPGPATRSGGIDIDTVAAYERAASEWATARTAGSFDRAAEWTKMAGVDEGATVDLGCGPGWHLRALPDKAIALDAARAMLDLTPSRAPRSPRVQADLARLPFGPGSLRAAFASKAYVHVLGTALPAALADLHRTLEKDAPVLLSFFGAGQGATGPSAFGEAFDDDPFPGRRFSRWNVDDLTAVVQGAGFESTQIEVTGEDDREMSHLWVTGHRGRTLPDTVGPGMRLLICGLNPSLRSADAGVGFVTPGNRFWPAARAAGIVTRDRDSFHALDAHGVGMTDLAKRATRRADELSPHEYRHGLARVEQMVRWLAPGAICFVGLAGYRVAVDRRAQAGPQSESLGECPVYVMPSTSGLNTHSRLDDLTAHLKQASHLAAG